jgi:hypothetical protein
VVGITVVTGIVLILHLSILPSTAGSAASFLVFGLIASTTIALLGLGIGSRFSNFNSADPQQLSTSLPGLAFMVLAVTYGIISAYILFQWFATDNALYPVMFLLGSIMCCGLVQFLVVQRLDEVEYIGLTHS